MNTPRRRTPCRVNRRWSLCLFALLSSMALASESPAPDTTLHGEWARQASAGLDPLALDALSRIEDPDRQLLALRAYLRAADSLHQRWSWSDRQIAAYPNTPAGRAAASDLDAVVAAFAAENPGYVLVANRTPRSLETQIAHWNENPAVGAVARRLGRMLDTQFGSSAMPDVAALRSALAQWQPPTAAPLAAPGLSAHGQARAFDFQIEHDGQAVARDEAAGAHRQWDEPGWTEKLRTAVRQAGDRFSGPLQSPYEPWHYAYADPSIASADAPH